MDRALDLSRSHGLGCLALGNTNHWMRGGTYGWQAAEAGFIGICWTNTMPNLLPGAEPSPASATIPSSSRFPGQKPRWSWTWPCRSFPMAPWKATKRGDLLPLDGGFDWQGT